MKKFNNIYNNCGRCTIGVGFNVGVKVGFNVGFNVGCSLPLHPERFFHSQKFHRTINQIYKANKGRRFTLVPFEENPIDGFSKLRDKLAVRAFFKKFYRKGGIYRFTLINKPNIFYIGSTRNFYSRFCKHTAQNALLYHYDLFHITANDCG